MTDTKRNPRVFISYAWESPEHIEQVGYLCCALRENGVDARWDRVAERERQDWAALLENEIRHADYVLVVASTAYKKRAEGDSDPDKGCGVRWEAGLISEALYRDKQELKRFLPVILPGQSAAGLPEFMRPRSCTSYRVEEVSAAGLEQLLRVLHDRPEEVESELGEVPPLPPVVRTVPRTVPNPGRRSVLAITGLALAAFGGTVLWPTSSDAQDRYDQAIRRLGDDSAAVRQAAIQDLGEIARDDQPKRATIMQALATHILTRSPVKDDDLTEDERPVPVSAEGKKPDGEIQAAATVIGQRDADVRIDLSRANLAGVDWQGAQLDGVVLHQANLTQANLTGAQLRQASLTNAQLKDAKLDGGKLVQTNFTNAWLEGGQLKQADATGAVFQSTTLWNADLSGTTLTDAEMEWAHIGLVVVRGTNLRVAKNAARSEFTHDKKLHYIVDELTVLP